MVYIQAVMLHNTDTNDGCMYEILDTEVESCRGEVCIFRHEAVCLPFPSLPGNLYLP